MNYTENLTLGLPEYGEDADVADLNRNSGILDAYCYNTRQIECEPYDSTKTYMSGDLSIHNEVVYECNTDNTTGTWDDSKWDSTTLAEQIAKAKQSGGGAEVTKEASGNPIEITDGADAPLIKCTTEIQGYQEGTGTPSPDNIRPIVAYNQSTISIHGRNIVKAFTTMSNTQYADALCADIELKPSTTYVLSFKNANVSSFYSNESLFDGQSNFSVTTAGGRAYAVVTTKSVLDKTDSSQYDTTNGWRLIKNWATQTNGFSEVMLETGSSASDYEPFTGNSESTATFSNPIYQGNADFVGGEVTTQKKKIVINGSEPYTYYHASIWHTGAFSITGALPDAVQVSGYGTIANLICNQAEVGKPIEVVTGIYGVGQGEETAIYIYLGDFADETQLKTYLSNNPLEIVYELATPTTSSVTPTNLPIKSLFGYNHIESSTGDMEIEYITEGYQPLVDLIQSSKHVYSTQEQIVGTWIDGSTLYEKTYEITMTCPANTRTDILALTDENIVSLVGRAYYTSNSMWYVSPYDMNINQYNNNRMIICTHQSGGNPVITLVNGGFSNAFDKVQFTIRYTKPTQTRSLSAPVTSQKAQIEPLTDKTEETPTEEEKAVNEEENNDETR